MAKAAPSRAPGRARGRHPGRARRAPEGPRPRASRSGSGASRRRTASAEVLGAERVEFLGYVDSGMMGDARERRPGSLLAGRRRRGRRAAGRDPREETPTCSRLRRQRRLRPSGPHPGAPGRPPRRRAGLEAAAGLRSDDEPRPHPSWHGRAPRASIQPEGDGAPDIENDENFGKPESVITARGRCQRLPRSASAIRCRRIRSQISDQSFFLQMPAEGFAYGFGTEWYIRRGQGPGITETALL